MLWEKWSRVFIPDPGGKKAPNPGSLIGSATLLVMVVFIGD
jgi:hypothetical protein